MAAALIVQVSVNQQKQDLLAAECRQVAQAFASSADALAGGGIEQDSRLVAILGYSITLQVEIGKQESRLPVVLGNRLPEPFGSFCGIASLAVRSVQIALRDR